MGVGLLPPNWLDGADYIGNQTATWLTYSRFQWGHPKPLQGGVRGVLCYLVVRGPLWHLGPFCQ